MGMGRGKGAKGASNATCKPTLSKEEILKLEKEALWVPPKKLRPADLELLYQMEKNGEMFCVTDPKTPDHAIVYASPKFLEFTGYTAKEIVGVNCRFLQGEETEPEDVHDIRTGISTQEDTAVFLYNYKKDGTGFYNQFYMTPMRKKFGIPFMQPGVAYFIGVQTECVAKEDKDAVANRCKQLREKQYALSQ
uniref:PAS domain-containing protein n=1 Tax=Timspurckia oligopyrenoides TaxID=708627 RepID=A0A7S0ZCS6_9RHOD|mmetsp:Transcript_12728/g.22893  ORF Transcript_12728/g.22893 Transcript_12728/m.22893 type:complete len:192 (+) Transcript_12728:301-876(+)|eukprot:CAMPEP_0182446692 /NCGR_PEP_ID=MMETSP1172-20130603/4607_1 /TAXON_ID=708627 /ORGANISM="Timspurckia oligopyrenoides, Strain CCMP3278" /LENGTH=191 /DNA_ID=CAMNT_0024642679 /DNA_START=205 /DNA_END=780 /DNA_ORIENTATION=-